MAKAKTMQEICSKIRDLVGQINSWDGSSGEEEKIWRENQQQLLQILAENPMDVYPLDSKLKEEVQSIVIGYLHWSFNGYW